MLVVFILYGNGILKTSGCNMTISGASTELQANKAATGYTKQILNMPQTQTYNPWDVMYKGVTNFALEHVLAGNGARHAGSAGGVTWTLPKSGDIIHSCYLQADLPSLTPSSGYAEHVSWVWGLGYAMIMSATFSVASTQIEKISGQWMEMHEELHQAAGTRLEEAVLKMDRVTLPEMAKISATPGGTTLYVPIPFFFTKGAHAALPAIAMSCHDLEVNIVFKRDATGKPSQLVTCLDDAQDTDLGAKASYSVNGVGRDLEWNDIDFSLWCGTVHLDSEERNNMAKSNHNLLMKTVQQYSSISTIDGERFVEKSKNFYNLSFTHPVSSLVWAIADRNRHAREACNDGEKIKGRRSHENSDSFATEDLRLFTGGVRALYGTPCSLVTAGTVNDGQSDKMDWNVFRPGYSVVGTFDTDAFGDTTPPAAANLLSSSAVNEWRNDGLNGCLHLPGNPFDYRMTNAAGEEIEPMEKFKMTFNNADRVDTDLSPEFYRTVQGAEHFANVPRKGIYCYSFAKNASSPYVNGVCNFSKILDKTIEIHKNPQHVDNVGTLDSQRNNRANGDASEYEVYLYAESFNIFKVKEGAVGLAW